MTQLIKAPRLQIGTGTLGRFKRSRPLVTLSLRDNGYGAGASFGVAPVSNWTCMSAAEARRLGERLINAAARAERGGR